MATPSAADEQSEDARRRTERDHGQPPAPRQGRRHPRREGDQIAVAEHPDSRPGRRRQSGPEAPGPCLLHRPRDGEALGQAPVEVSHQHGAVAVLRNLRKPLSYIDDAERERRGLSVLRRMYAGAGIQ